MKSLDIVLVSSLNCAMHSHASYLLCALAVAVRIVTAVPTFGGSGCNTGSINCCESIQSTSDPEVQTLAGLFGIVLPLPNVPTLIGVHCNPISAVGLGSNGCTEQPACCTGNQMAGVLTFGCNPLNVNM